MCLSVPGFKFGEDGEKAPCPALAPSGKGRLPRGGVDKKGAFRKRTGMKDGGAQRDSRQPGLTE